MCQAPFKELDMALRNKKDMTPTLGELFIYCGNLTCKYIMQSNVRLCQTVLLLNCVSLDKLFQISN